MLSALVNIVLMLVFSAIVIMIVSKLNAGLFVDGFGSAMIAAAVIAIVGGVVSWLLSFLNLGFGILIGVIVYVIVAAIVLLISDKFVKGMKVDGFAGAIMAAVAIATLNWLITLTLGLVFS